MNRYEKLEEKTYEVTDVVSGLEAGMYEEGFQWMEAIADDWDMRSRPAAEFVQKWGGLTLPELKQIVVNSNTALTSDETELILDALYASEDDRSGDILDKAWKAWEDGLWYGYACVMQFVEDRLIEEEREAE